MAERAQSLPNADSENISDLGFLISQVGDHSQRFFGRLMEPLGLRPSHVGVLRAIVGSKGLTQRELGERLGIFASNLVKLIDELEQRALVKRVQREGDRRSYNLFLTREGERAVKDIARKVHEHQSAMCSALLPAEQNELHRLLQKVAGERGLRPGVHPELSEGKNRKPQPRAWPAANQPQRSQRMSSEFT